MTNNSAIVITVSNTKGGTGKTTTCLNLATELGLLGHKVLLIDLDPQASLSKALLGEQGLSGFKGMEDFLNQPSLKASDFTVATKISHVSVIPCHGQLAEVSLKLVLKASFYSLKDVLRNVSGFDFILLDTQPSKNILMLNAFAACDYVLVPTNPGVYPLLDILELEETIQSTALNCNPGLKLLGVLITMMQRGTVYRQLECDLRDYFKERVFKTVISRLVKSEESAVEGLGVSALDPGCKLSLQYRSLTEELLGRLTVPAGG